MAQKKKLLDKVRRNIRNVSREDFEALINAYGYVEEGGKHPQAIIESYTMSYKREKRIKSCYGLVRYYRQLVKLQILLIEMKIKNDDHKKRFRILCQLALPHYSRNMG